MTLKSLPYLVQFADSFGFDFGGENGGIAAFRHKGSAYNYAKETRDNTGRDCRVLDMSKKGKVEFYLEGKQRS
jgi:hypothetical protein